MGMRQGIKLLGGSIVVYVVVAACGSQGPAGQVAGTGGSDGTGGVSSNIGGGNGLREAGTIDDGNGIIDALTNPVPDARAENVSGTRLRAKYLVSPDGARQWQGWHDMQLDFDCAFVASSVGIQRCLPTSVTLLLAAYGDNKCIEPLYGSLGCGTPKYVVDAAPDQCGTLAHVYAVGPMVADLDQVYKAGTCAPITASAARGMSAIVFHRGPEIPLDMFVSAAARVE